MFDTIIKHQSNVEKLHKKLKTNIKNENQNECEKCTFCCWGRPCSLAESDIKPIADYLKITPQKLFMEYLVVDEFNIGDFLLLPRRKSQADIAGTFVPTKRTYDIDTPCMFLDETEKKCTIHSVKPSGGREFKCWGDDTTAKNKYVSKSTLIELGFEINDDI